MFHQIGTHLTNVYNFHGHPCSQSTWTDMTNYLIPFLFLILCCIILGHGLPTELCSFWPLLLPPSYAVCQKDNMVNWQQHMHVWHVETKIKTHPNLLPKPVLVLRLPSLKSMPYVTRRMVTQYSQESIHLWHMETRKMKPDMSQHVWTLM